MQMPDKMNKLKYGLANDNLAWEDGMELLGPGRGGPYSNEQSCFFFEDPISRSETNFS